ncbi:MULTISPECIES: hypothetical protein [Bradyrhizobium]|uniref:hypothetical protein n=1 Tax=Bradyrhizobium TaxID=374 RepID=UPI0004B489C7|nr:hypothetical protein [Bradyrhizobium sp. CCBAU 15544]
MPAYNKRRREREFEENEAEKAAAKADAERAGWVYDKETITWTNPAYPELKFLGAAIHIPKQYR